MKPHEARKLLGGYAAGTLTGEERRALFEAALEDPELFNELGREQALKELLEDPGARRRLLEALEEPTSWVDRLRAWVARPVAWVAVGSMAVAGVLVVVLVRRPATPPPPEPVLMAKLQQAPAAEVEEAPEAARSTPRPADQRVDRPAPLAEKSENEAERKDAKEFDIGPPPPPPTKPAPTPAMTRQSVEVVAGAQPTQMAKSQEINQLAETQMELPLAGRAALEFRISAQGGAGTGGPAERPASTTEKSEPKLALEAAMARQSVDVKAEAEPAQVAKSEERNEVEGAGLAGPAAGRRPLAAPSAAPSGAGTGGVVGGLAVRDTMAAVPITYRILRAGSDEKYAEAARGTVFPQTDRVRVVFVPAQSGRLVVTAAGRPAPLLDSSATRNTEINLDVPPAIEKITVVFTPQLAGRAGAATRATDGAGGGRFEIQIPRAAGP